ncbi:uncharacterized protein LOC112593400 [Melanaphis sacchari]|uniref:uncharacterized protein LOC112593400 n=1 Tax=Melanaphis sacchari TaxID=742174 RepID=UPI000DC146E9|nr:uncharacterized protein LOC112593400 [Melanaphis sacchari]
MTREMIACKRSDDDGTAKSGSGCAHRTRQAEWSVLSHGLCAAIIALTALRVLPTMAACLVSVCFLQSPVLKTLSSSLSRFLGMRGRRSSQANGSDVGVGHGGRPVSRKCLLAPPSTNYSDTLPPVPSTSGDDDDVPPRSTPTNGRGTLPLVKSSLRLLKSVMRGAQRSVVDRPKRSRRSSRPRCRDTASKGAVTTCNDIIAKTVETITGYRVNDDFVRCTQRQYLTCTTREQR